MVKVECFRNDGAPHRTLVFKRNCYSTKYPLESVFWMMCFSDRKWKVNIGEGFDHQILKEINFLPNLFLSSNLRKILVSLNKSLLFELLHNSCEVNRND